MTQLLSNMIAAGGLLHQAKVGLYRDGLVLGTETNIDDVIPYAPRWTGYSEQAIMAWSPVDVRSGTYRVYASSVTWHVAAYPPGVDPDVVAGYYVRAGGDGPLLWLENFPNPVLAVIGSVFPIVAECGFRWEELANYLPLWS